MHGVKSQGEEAKIAQDRYSRKGRMARCLLRMRGGGRRERQRTQAAGSEAAERICRPQWVLFISL